jgi:hypothetical protein
MLIKLVVLTVLTVPSIMATMSPEEIAKALIAEKNTGKLEQTFEDLHKKHSDYDSSWALSDVARQGHPGIVATCLRVEQDPFPNDKMCMSYLVNNTLTEISKNTSDDSESFAKVITSFKPTDVKPLASIRHRILFRKDAVKILKRVMDKSPELIIGNLPSWLASHMFDQNSSYYTWHQTALEEAFYYLAPFATESVLEEALSIAKANEHYKVDLSNGPKVMCCNFQDSFPKDLLDKLTGLLKLMKARNEIIRGTLQSLLPKVLVDLMLDYITYDTIDSPTSSPETIIGTKRKHR